VTKLDTGCIVGIKTKVSAFNRIEDSHHVSFDS